MNRSAMILLKDFVMLPILDSCVIPFKIKSYQKVLGSLRKDYELHLLSAIDND